MKAHKRAIFVTLVILSICLEITGKKSKKMDFARGFEKKLRELKRVYKGTKMFRYSGEPESRESEQSISDSASSSYENVTPLGPGPVGIRGVILQAEDTPLAVKAFMSFVKKFGCSNVIGYRKFMMHYKDANNAGQFKGSAANNTILLNLSTIAGQEQMELDRKCPPVSPQRYCKA